jgi:hypothetical protein
MNKRIRYFEETPGVFLSVRTISTDKGHVRVRYNKDNMVVLIMKAEDETVLDTFTAPNPFVMKKTIKEKLVEMGAAFQTETRKTGE